jgi:hypothetical protein
LRHRVLGDKALHPTDHENAKSDTEFKGYHSVAGQPAKEIIRALTSDAKRSTRGMERQDDVTVFVLGARKEN